jgi:DNA-binding transcriptional MerR regulator
LDKAPDAFRTISEVADEIDVPQHVLRFWESRFTQIKPMKRGGGRRYYRPDDIDLLRGIRYLLYGEGYTIRGVQRILRDEGAAFVQDVWRAGAAAPPAQSRDDIAKDDIAEDDVAEEDFAEAPGESRPEPDLSSLTLSPLPAEARAPGPEPLAERREPVLAAPAPAGRLNSAGEAKLRDALNELIACRRLIDAAMSDADPAEQTGRSGEI